MEDTLLEATPNYDPLVAASWDEAAMRQRHALIVEGRGLATGVLRQMLQEQGYRVSVCTSIVDVIAMAREGLTPDIAFVSLARTPNTSTAGLGQLRKLSCLLPVVAVSSSTEAREIIAAIRSGASDALLEPVDSSELSALLQRHVNRPVMDSAHPYQQIPVSANSSLVFCSYRMQKIAAQAALVAKFDLPVLIMGESGTGKEVIAQYIHRMSNCAGRTFLKVNCAAMPSDLLESELLGYEQGAFTGAMKSKPGKFELCDNGTIFLDEIGEMPAGLQAKLLQVLQDGTFSRLGGRTTVKVNARVIAATNVDIKSAITQRRFREDLYYRLNGYSLLIPPLRERREEIPFLLSHFIKTLSAKYARVPVSVSDALVAACTNSPWPGNVRELENFVKRFLVLGDEGMMLEELAACAGPSTSRTNEFATTGLPEAGLKHMVKSLKGEAEAEAISQALFRNGGRHKQTAAELKISYKALLYKIRQYRIEESRDRGLATASAETA